MSKNARTASEKEPDEPQSDSVFDFLYCDTRRIASFLSQFDDSGHLERVIQRDSATLGSRRGWKIGLGGGGLVVGTGGSGNASFEISPNSSGTEASERIYDPLWANALTLLDYLETEKLLHREAVNARIGQFVIVSGDLSVMDLSLFKGMWQLPAIRSLISAGALSGGGDAEPQGGNRHERRAAKQRATPKPTEDSDALRAIDAGIDIVGMLPHAIQARLTMGSNVFWTSLNGDGLLVSSSDLILKHGTSIAGLWSMVGILDAFPEADGSGGLTEHGQNAVLSAISISGSPFGAMMGQMMPHLRPMLGRPLDAYGITPLIIFREIAA